MDLVVAWSVVSSLYFLGFDEESLATYIIDQLVRVLFIIDIVIIFLTEIINDRGNMERSHRKIALHYIKSGQLFLDVIACIPFREAGYPDVEYLLRLVRLRKLPNALNMIDGRGFSAILSFAYRKVTRNEKVNINYKNRYIGQMLQLLTILLLLCYSIGCFWWWYVDAVRHEPNTDEIFYDSKYDYDV